MIVSAPILDSAVSEAPASGPTTFLPMDIVGLPIQIDLRPIVEMTDAQFLLFSAINQPLRFERKATGEIIVMAPEGVETGSRNAELGMRLRMWAKSDGQGVAFGATAGFKLPSGAIYSPDAAWVRKERLEQLNKADRTGFPPLCPDFVVELRSPSDRLRDIKDKMAEYMGNGCQLGWLLDPKDRSVYLYRSGHPVEHLQNPESVSGDPVLAGFVLTLADIWDPGF